MAFQLSPGVVVTETDLTSVVPAVASTTGAFVAFSGANLITGSTYGATGTPQSTSSETVTLANNNTAVFTAGYANPELDPDSGDIVYIENRKPIQRASDQTEDIKLIIEF